MTTQVRRAKRFHDRRDAMAREWDTEIYPRILEESRTGKRNSYERAMQVRSLENKG